MREPLRARPGSFLTGPSDERPVTVALDYVRAHPGTFELDGNDLAGLRLTRAYRSGGGDAHLQWEQVYRGIPVFGPGLRANVAADGRLINVGEAALPDPGVSSIEPRLSALDAVLAAARAANAAVAPGQPSEPRGSERAVAFTSGDLASLTLFGGDRLAWRVRLHADPTHVYDAVVDASTGASLYRVNMVKEAVPAHVFENYPGAPFGGTRILADLTPWLSSSSALVGPYAHVYSDAGDNIDGFPPDGSVTMADEIPPASPASWDYPYTAAAASTGQHCPPSPGCSWNAFAPGFSWTMNRGQEGTQLFYYVNRYHDHLRDTPGIGFGTGSHNFEGIDAVQAQVDDGAGTEGGLPQCEPTDYTNNAYALPVPEGQPLLLQFYLWTSRCSGGTANDVNPADDALIVDHEYTHGMTNRLVTDASGSPALNGPQPGAMDEGLADWYSLDFLVGRGLEMDTATPGQLKAGVYESSELRSQPFDCPIGADPLRCPGAGAAGSGGYTYGDFGRIFFNGASLQPEVHADGEIWVETLWDLRTRMIAAHGAATGLTRTDALVTDGLRLSPADPTYLNMRDAILQANANRGYGDSALIWSVFAARGMGARATSTGAGDTHPIQDFSLPVASTPPPPLTIDKKRPSISASSLTRKRFKVGTRVAFKFTLSEVATVELDFSAAHSGRRAKGRCRPATHKLRKRPRCTRYVAAGSLVRINMSAGAHSIGFAGKLRGHSLKVGGYKVTIRATDPSGNRSHVTTTSFRIVRR
jgi:extracellular elastinolytic metalloproteinase